jgi:hypothetical protein
MEAQRHILVHFCARRNVGHLHWTAIIDVRVLVGASWVLAGMYS